MFSEDYWITIAKVFNLSLIYISVLIINRNVKGNYLTIAIISLLATSLTGLFESSAKLFETSLAFSSIILLYHFLTRKRFAKSLILSGSLYLVRPELIVITVSANVYIFYTLIKSKIHLKRYLMILATSFIPLVIYHSYMFIHTKRLYSSSNFGRYLTSIESGESWIVLLINSLKQISFGYGGLIYTVSVLILSLIILKSNLPKYKLELFLIVPILLIFLINPPGMYIGRYLLPVSGLLIIIIIRFLIDNFNMSLFQQKKKQLVLAIFSILNIIFINTTVNANSELNGTKRYDRDLLMLKDLAFKLNNISDSKDSILIYEVQSQYYLKARCVSLDGILGHQMHPFLTRNSTLEEIIEQDKSIKYIVTMNSFNYRKIFNNTLLVDLYLHDLNNSVGATYETKDFAYSKIITNPAFDQPSLHDNIKWDNLNSGKHLRLYNSEASQSWKSAHPFWNSVYKINRL